MASSFILDKDRNRITFLDNRFYLSPNGVYLPSSTTILDSYPKNFGFMEWLKKNGEDSDAIRDEAGRRGSLVHDLTERFDKGEEISLLNDGGYPAMKMSEWNMFEKYVEFRRSTKSEIIENELSLVSDETGYGGTIDRVMRIEKKRWLVDIKTSNYLSNHFWLQLASYKELLSKVANMRVDGIAILWLNAKTRTEGKNGAIQGQGWQFLMCDNKKREIDRYMRLFKATHSLWLEENEGAKPREFTYSLKHKL